MFFGTFSRSFVYVSLPFHIQRISTWDATSTPRWTGWILGISPLATVAMAPLGGRLAGRGNPKAYFAFISAGRADDPGEVRRQVAGMQSAMTVGGVIGPLCGAIAAARLGFAESFVLGGLVLFGCGALVHWGVPASTPPPAGSLAAPRLAELLPERRLIAGLLVGSSVSVGALAVAPGVWSYGVLRFVQVLCIAPVFPIVVARIAQTHGGEAIGVINAARIGASFVGPVVATSLLAAGSPMLLYAVLALAGLACLPLSAMRAHIPAVAR